MDSELNDNKESQKEKEYNLPNNNIYTGLILSVIMFLIIVSLLISNIEQTKNNPNMKKLVYAGCNLLSIKNLPGDKIPDKVIENTTKRDVLANVLYADKKVIYYAYSKESKESKDYLQELEKLISKNPDIIQKYYYYPDAKGTTRSLNCEKPGVTDCVQNFLYRNCTKYVCIINGAKKQFKTISSKDAEFAYDEIVHNLEW